MAHPVNDPLVTSDSDDAYHPQDALGQSARAAAITGAAGLFLASVQNTVAKENIGAFGVFSRFGSTVGLFAAMGGTYSFASIASANLRAKDDFINHGIGGACAGALAGLAKRSMPAVLGNGLALGVVTATVGYTRLSFFESSSDEPSLDRLAQKEEAKTRYRRPINETINEIGEGRGIYGPGYQERRKQRIKEKYGIDIEEPYYTQK